MDAATRDFVRRRADNRCEYCLLRQKHSRLTHHVEHIVAKQHGGLESVVSSFHSALTVHREGKSRKFLRVFRRNRANRIGRENRKNREYQKNRINRGCRGLPPSLAACTERSRMGRGSDCPLPQSRGSVARLLTRVARIGLPLFPLSAILGTGHGGYSLSYSARAR